MKSRGTSFGPWGTRWELLLTDFAPGVIAELYIGRQMRCLPSLSRFLTLSLFLQLPRLCPIPGSYTRPFGNHRGSLLCILALSNLVEPVCLTLLVVGIMTRMLSQTGPLVACPDFHDDVLQCIFFIF